MPETEYYDKFEAAAYLGCSHDNIRYHLYVSKKMPAGRFIGNTRVWTKAELDAFRALDLRPGYRPPEGRYVTPRQFLADDYAAQIEAGTIQVSRDGAIVYEVARDPDDAFYYALYTSDGAFRVRANVRMRVEERQPAP